MGTYVCLCRWTQKGMEDVKQSADRHEEFKAMLRSGGGQLKGFYLTMGRFDFIAVIETKDDASAARLVLQLGSGGNVRTETLKAFEEAEYRKLLGSL